MTFPSMIPLFPEQEEALCSRRKIFLQQGEFTDAIPLFEELYNSSIDSDVKAKAGYELGLAYKGASRSRDALNLFSAIIKEHPQSEYVAGALYEIGQHLEKGGAGDKALPYYRKAAGMKQSGEPAALAAKALARLGG
jgi:tetratricopeptide (TPR) repeat protein